MKAKQNGSQLEKKDHTKKNGISKKKKDPKRKKTCPYCSNLFNASTIARHIKRIHLGKDKKKCPHCNNMYSSSNLKEHIRAMHTKEKGKKKCPHCNKMITSVYLKEHIRHMHTKDKGRKKCPHCYKMYFSSYLNTHIRTMHTKDKGKKKKCPHCNKMYSNIWRHIKTVHEGIKAKRKKCLNKCYFCGVIYRGENEEFLRHMRNKHLTEPAEDGSYTCYFCKKEGCWAYHLSKVHLREKFRDKRQTRLVTCYFCQKQCSMTNYYRHFRNQHLGESIKKNLKCHFCPYVTSTGTTLTPHYERNHFNVRQSRGTQCYFCQKKFYNVQEHIRKMHLSERPDLFEGLQRQDEFDKMVIVNASEIDKQIMLLKIQDIRHPFERDILKVSKATKLPTGAIRYFYAHKRSNDQKVYNAYVDTVLTDELKLLIVHRFKEKTYTEKKPKETCVREIADELNLHTDIIHSYLNRTPRIHKPIHLIQLEEYFKEHGFPERHYDKRVLAERFNVHYTTIRYFFNLKRRLLNNKFMKQDSKTIVNREKFPPLITAVKKTKKQMKKDMLDMQKEFIDYQLKSDRLDKKCYFCAKKLSSMNTLNNHVLGHLHETRIYKCRLCKGYVDARISLHEHLRICGVKTGISGEWSGGCRCKCGFCDNVFRTVVALKTHINMEHEHVDNPIDHFVCNKCEEKFSVDQHLFDHILECQAIVTEADKNIPFIKCKRRSSTTGKRKCLVPTSYEYTCVICGVKLYHANAVSNHVFIHRYRNHTCKVPGCNRPHLADYFLRSHIARVHNNGMFRCLYTPCQKQLTSLHGIRSHELNAHSRVSKSHCKYCFKEFLSYRSKRQHEQAVHENVKYTCKYKFCDFVTAYKETLALHYKSIRHVPIFNVNNTIKPWKEYKDKDSLAFYHHMQRILIRIRNKIDQKTFHVYVCIAVPIEECNFPNFELEFWLNDNRNIFKQVPIYIGKVTTYNDSEDISRYHYHGSQSSSIRKLMLKNTHKVFFVKKWRYASREEAEKNEAILQFFVWYKYKIFMSNKITTQLLFTPLFKKLEQRKLLLFTKEQKFCTVLVAKMMNRPLFCLHYDCKDALHAHSNLNDEFPVKAMYHLDAKDFKEIK